MNKITNSGNDVSEPLEERNKKSPLIYFLVFFMIFILIVWIIPAYTFKQYINPKSIPKLSDFNINSSQGYAYTSIKDLYKALNLDRARIKDIADTIVVKSCPENNRLCYAKALYYFVRDNIQYVSDPVNEEYIESPLQILSTGAADCESGSVLLVAMLRSIGVEADFVLIPGHAFVKATLPEAPFWYRKQGNLVYMDWTCKSCSFGELPKTDWDYLK